MRGGADPAYVQQVLGHKFLDMTLHYAGIDEDKKHDALEVFARALGAGLKGAASTAVPALSEGPIA